jgi:hypothetical protein
MGILLALYVKLKKGGTSMKLTTLLILMAAVLFVVNCTAVTPKPTFQSGDFPEMVMETPYGETSPYDLVSYGPFVAPDEAAAIQDTIRRLPQENYNNY